MTKLFVFYIIFFGLCISFSNNTKSQSVKRFYISQNKVKQNFSTSIKIIDLSRLKLASSSSASTLSYLTTVTPKVTKLIKKRKKLKIKRKKLQRIFKNNDTMFDGKLTLGVYFFLSFYLGIFYSCFF